VRELKLIAPGTEPILVHHIEEADEANRGF
jgi:hypothetical protein